MLFLFGASVLCAVLYSVLYMYYLIVGYCGAIH